MCIFLAMSLLIWVEVFSRFPDKGGSSRLQWFENLLSFAMLGMVVYWVFEFSIVFDQALVLVLFLVIAQIFLFCWSCATKRFDLFRRIFNAKPGERRRLRLAIGLFSIALFAVIAFALAVAITPRVKVFLTKGRKAILEMSLTDVLGTNKPPASLK